jgi:hypothetical protein
MNVTLNTANIAAYLALDADNPNVDPAFDPDEKNWPDCLPALPGPWHMSIAELDSWVAYYRSRLRGLGRGCGALTPTEEAHRAEVEGQVNSRHEARRHSAFGR